MISVIVICITAIIISVVVSNSDVKVTITHRVENETAPMLNVEETKEETKYSFDEVLQSVNEIMGGMTYED